MSKTIKIGNRVVGDGHPCFIIAEVGCNHNGSLAQAKKLIDAAVEAGCDAAKFQSFSAEKLFNVHWPDYKKDWIKLIKSLELPKEWHKKLADYCKRRGILFFTSVCDEEKVDWVNQVGCPVYKIPSYELTHHPLLRYAARFNKPFILSTGIAVEAEIQETLEVLKGSDIAIMHCVSSYPGKIEDLNLRTIPYYKQRFGIPVGLSDHCEWPLSGAAAVALGANIVEKHITLDRNMPGPDHSFALEPTGLKQMVKEIRNVERALGNIKRGPAPGEKNEVEWRRALWAAKDINANRFLEKDDIMIVRPSPGGSLPPKALYKLLGRRVITNIKQGELITLDKLER